MKRILAIIFGIFAFVGLVMAGALLVMSEDDVVEITRPLPLIGQHAEKIADIKAEFSDGVEHTLDDAIYGVKSTWRSLTDFSFGNHPQRVVIELEPVRAKRPKRAAPPSAPAAPEQMPENNDAHTLNNAHQAPNAAPQMEPMPHQPALSSPPVETEPKVAEKTFTNAAPDVPDASAEPKRLPAHEKKTPESTLSPKQHEEPTTPTPQTTEIAQTTTSKPSEPEPAEQVATETASLHPPKKPPPPAPKADSGADEHKQGLTYYKGIGGVARNYKTAAKWFRESAAKGNAAAQYNLGIMSYLGQGMEQSYEQAADWFRQAATQDHALAQYNLGFLFYEGKGVEKDNLQAFMWIDRAARLGDEKAIKARDTLEKVLPKDILKAR